MKTVDTLQAGFLTEDSRLAPFPSFRTVVMSRAIHLQRRARLRISLSSLLSAMQHLKCFMLFYYHITFAPGVKIKCKSFNPKVI